MTEDMISYHREWWESERADPRRVVFDALNRYVEDRIPWAPAPGILGTRAKALDLGCGRGTVTAMLVNKDYEVTAVDIDPVFLAEVKRKLPGVRAIRADIRNLKLDGMFDLVTCIETAQNLDPWQLWHLLYWLKGHARRLFINISNGNSLYSRWLRLRGWQNPFVYTYKPSFFEWMVENVGFSITHRKGFGLVMPMSLRKDYKWPFVEARLASAINRLDDYATRSCHLYYVECENEARV